MQVHSTNDIKIYNLSAGKSVPEWINDRKRRKLEQKDADLRRRIQLIQDFEMPDISNTIDISPDGRYIFATGTYKPFLKCFDVNDLSMKFSRGLDADVVRMLILGEDFSKFLLLEEERYLEMHAAYGRYFRMRIPKFGRDMAFCRETSDVYIVGAGNEIFRLNLEEGKFHEPFLSSSSSLTCCEFNQDHGLFICGTSDGCVEAWDHRDRSRCAILNCGAFVSTNQFHSGIPYVSSVKYKDALHLAVGLSSGHIMLHDIRSSRPMLVKNQRSGLPISRIDYVSDHNLVLSMDSRILKIWSEIDGSPFAAIEPGTILTDFRRYPDSGLLLFANEAPKMLQYFVPSLGIAPKWCSYLESITEELEETEQPSVYDDYKFVTAQQLEEIGLSHLIGTSLLRAYMHGYFIDMRLYDKAKTFTQPFAYENYKAQKIMERIQEERKICSNIMKDEERKLPKVNKELAMKLIAEKSLSQSKDVNKKTKKKGREATEILIDDRFKSLFVNSDFQVDPESEQYKLLTPGLKKLEEKRNRINAESNVDEVDEPEILSSLYMDDEDAHQSTSTISDEDSLSDMGKHSDEDSDVDEKNDEFDCDQQECHDGAMVKMNSKSASKDMAKSRSREKFSSFELMELNVSEDISPFLTHAKEGQESNVTTLGEKREDAIEENVNVESASSFGGRQMTFTTKSRSGTAKKELTEERQRQHLEERKNLRRSGRAITRTLKRLPVRGGFRGRGSSRR